MRGTWQTTDSGGRGGGRILAVLAVTAVLAASGALTAIAHAAEVIVITVGVVVVLLAAGALCVAPRLIRLQERREELWGEQRRARLAAQQPAELPRAQEASRCRAAHPLPLPRGAGLQAASGTGDRLAGRRPGAADGARGRGLTASVADSAGPRGQDRTPPGDHATPYRNREDRTVNGDDRAAARRLLWNMRQRLENLQCDLISLYRALDGPPGAVSVLAAELLDEDQDRVPGPGSTRAPTTRSRDDSRGDQLADHTLPGTAGEPVAPALPGRAGGTQSPGPPQASPTHTAGPAFICCSVKWIVPGTPDTLIP